MFSSYHIESKTFIEASCTNNIHTEKKTFCDYYTFEALWIGLGIVSFQTE